MILDFYFLRFAALATACLLSGCATEVGTFTLLGSARAPKAGDHSIEVFTKGLPKRPFKRIATLDAHCESQWFMAPTLEHDALPELRRQARVAGCDAIVEIQEKQAGNSNFETRAKLYTAVGVAYE